MRDLGNPESKDKRTKACGSQADMANRARYLNKMMARRHGDGRYHAYIAPDNSKETNNPMITRTATFRCYDGIGNLVPGWFTEAEAIALVQANEEWTYSEVL